MKSVKLSLAVVGFAVSACTHQPQRQEATDEAALLSELPPAFARTPSAQPRSGIVPPNQQEIARNCELSPRLAKLPDSIYLKHKAMLINYNPRRRVPNWVYNEIYRENLERSCEKRPSSGSFKTDPQLQALIEGFDARNDISLLNSKSYASTGFDRGHLAPNGDFAFEPETQKQSFYMTNMMPQEPDVNQVSWAALEGRVRKMACGMGHLRVYTGPLYGPRESSLESCAAIPESYYKVILSVREGRYQGIAFIYSQNDRKSAGLDPQLLKGDFAAQRVVSIAEVERRSGLRFFEEFAEDLQRGFKNQADLAAWTQASCEKRLCPKKGGARESAETED